MQVDNAARRNAFKRGRAEEWTRERIEQLETAEIKQLRGNAERLGEAALASLCEDVLGTRPRSGVKKIHGAPKAKATSKLIARSKAFEARGVRLSDTRSSWGGVRKADGAIVMALWAELIESAAGTCSYLLWAPNVDGARPWSDKPAGKERAEHCARAMELGGAEGLLVHGQRLDTHLPEDKAHSIHGVDAETVIAFAVEKRGREFWAVWGSRTPK